MVPAGRVSGSFAAGDSESSTRHIPALHAHGCRARRAANHTRWLVSVEARTSAAAGRRLVPCGATLAKARHGINCKSWR